jgi:hypothetical protein
VNSVLCDMSRYITGFMFILTARNIIGSSVIQELERLLTSIHFNGQEQYCLRLRLATAI